MFLNINLFKRFPEVNNLATKKQKAAKRAKTDQETNNNIQKPVEEVKESEDKTKKQDKKRK